MFTCLWLVIILNNTVSISIIFGYCTIPCLQRVKPFCNKGKRESNESDLKLFNLEDDFNLSPAKLPLSLGRETIILLEMYRFKLQNFLNQLKWRKSPNFAMQHIPISYFGGS